MFKLKNAPLSIVLIFNVFTLILFYTAPLNWQTDNMFLFLVFSCLCMLMIAFGFQAGYTRKVSKALPSAALHNLSNKDYRFVLWFYLATSLIKYAYLMRVEILDVKGMFNFLLLGVLDPNLGYSLSLDASRPYTVSWFLYFLTSIINQLFFVVGFLKWNDVNVRNKVLFCFLVGIELFFWIGRGTNFGVINMITVFVFCTLPKINWSNLKPKKLLSYLLGGLLSLVISIGFFSYNMNSRRGDAVLDYQQFNLGNASVDENDGIFAIIPDGLHDTYMYVVSYLTQGYYHTCLAFDLDYRSTFLLGNNPASIEFAKIFGIDVFEDTYVSRLADKGVDPLINWHSSYTWFASDVTFFGVPFLILLLSYLFGVSWNLCASYNDFLSKVIFVVLGNMFIYLFANNNYMASIFYSLLIFLPIWFVTRILQVKFR